MTAFTDFALDARLQQALKRASFETPTPIQVRALPLALEGRDLIGTAQTGTGKTAVFVLPILQRLLTDTSKLGRTRALIVTPTRELAEQILEMIRRFSQGTPIRSAAVYGGVGMEPQLRALRAGVEIVVACPGRLLDHIGRGTALLSGVEVLVLDEADRMLDMGFLPAVKRILQHVPASRQTMLFSATFAPELEQLAARTLRNPTRIDAGSGTPVKTIAHALYPVAGHLKSALLIHVLRESDTRSVLVFTRTKHRANRVAEHLQRAGFATAALHANKSQSQRQRALDDFRRGRVQVLVATDIAARGLDVESVSHVINYDIPDTSDTYIHRIGRTGRAERDGDALTLVSPEDAATVRDIERALRAPIERRTMTGFDYAKPAPEPGAQPFRHERRGPRQQSGRPPVGRGQASGERAPRGRDRFAGSRG